jgi:hypothetical protein
MKLIAAVTSNMNILDNLPDLKNNPSNIQRLAVLLARSLEKGSRLNEVHDKLYAITEKLSDHKFKYESAIATTLTTLANSVAKHNAQQVQANRLVAAPKSHVIKSHLKPKVVKAIEVPRNIYLCHIKALLDVVAKNEQQATMVAAGVPAAMVQQTVGNVIDPVVGAGAASDDIWGPVV